MRVGVLGVGAIGGLIASRLALTDADLHLFVHEHAAPNLIVEGLTLISPDAQSKHIAGERWSVHASNDPEPGLVDVLFICLKANDLSNITNEMFRTLTPSGVLVCMMNGLGHEESLRTRGVHQRMYRSVISHGALRRDKGVVEWMGRGAIEIGPGPDFTDSPSALIALMNEAGLVARWNADILDRQWWKLCINVAINPTCAIAGIPNGGLLEHSGLGDVALCALLESRSVAEAAGRDVPDAGALVEGYRKVVATTARNRCSMLQDIMRGRPTEVDALTGHVLRVAEQVGVSTPTVVTLDALLRGIVRFTSQSLS
ncbi:MAG TPA: 2-dehydropantoate 2-reductase [Candidatus Poseidoniales archaeon]|nr:2-dehydropantoate 2-reductase [Candidatus Poseidoniales archaeon]